MTDEKTIEYACLSHGVSFNEYTCSSHEKRSDMKKTRKEAPDVLSTTHIFGEGRNFLYIHYFLLVLFVFYTRHHVSDVSKIFSASFMSPHSPFHPQHTVPVWFVTTFRQTAGKLCRLLSMLSMATRWLSPIFLIFIFEEESDDDEHQINT